ncbi:hypothetical protein [Bradyrhizobium sp.]|uniref:hypothetical protein n=1 Tax=Bradyrhizobium sp. TaxID=376 RepID=UPI0035A16C87
MSLQSNSASLQWGAKKSSPPIKSIAASAIANAADRVASSDHWSNRTAIVGDPARPIAMLPMRRRNTMFEVDHSDFVQPEFGCAAFGLRVRSSLDEIQFASAG